MSRRGAVSGRGVLPGLCVLALLTLWPGGPADADPGVDYGPVPTGIAGVAADERDDALAAMGLSTLDHRRGDRELAASLLVMLDDVGLKAVATRLARGDVPARAKGPLLQVVASSEHPEADLLLARAAAEARPGLRMIAADGLGRGRSPAAVPALARLALDDVPGVRIAALRSLFAIESPQAVAARMDVPPDREPGLLATRLRWHRRCEDVSPGLRALAEAAYRDGRTVELRTAAARYLAMPVANAAPDVLGKIMLEAGGHPVVVALLRTAAGLPRAGYDAVEMRRIAIEAALTLLSRADVPALVGLLVFLLSSVHFEVLPVPSRRPELLCGLFMVLAVWLQLSPRALGRGWPAWSSVAATVLALASKETAFILPALVFIAVGFFSPGTSWRERWKNGLIASLPHLIAAVLFACVRLPILGGSVGMPRTPCRRSWPRCPAHSMSSSWVCSGLRECSGHSASGSA